MFTAEGYTVTESNNLEPNAIRRIITFLSRMALFKGFRLAGTSRKQFVMKEINGGAGEVRTPDLRFRKTPNLFDAF